MKFITLKILICFASLAVNHHIIGMEKSKEIPKPIEYKYIELLPDKNYKSKELKLLQIGTKTKYFPGYIPPDAPQEKPSDESVFRRIAKDINGNYVDGRIRITETTKYPYRCFVQLELTFPNQKKATGSGTMVGPYHILTAAHNIHYNPLGQVTKVIAYCGRDGENKPFNEALAAHVFIPQKYLDNEPGYDFALIILDQPIGNKTGWLGCLHTESETILKNNSSVTGYPGDKPETGPGKGTEMWSMEHRVKKVGEELLYYEIDTFRGQSGSGVVTSLGIGGELMKIIIGVHVTGGDIDDLTDSNKATRLTLPKLESLIQLIAKYGFSTKNDDPELAITFTGDEYYFGKGVLQNFEAAVDAYSQISADDAESYGNAQRRLGEIYHFGYVGERPNIEKAVEHYQNAIKQKEDLSACAWAALRLGDIYHYSVKPDYQKALENYTIVNRQSQSLEALVHALVRLCEMHYCAHGIPENTQKAWGLISEAAELGKRVQHRDLQGVIRKWLGKMYLEGKGVDQSLALAQVMLEAASKEIESYDERNEVYGLLSKVYDELSKKE